MDALECWFWPSGRATTSTSSLSSSQWSPPSPSSSTPSSSPLPRLAISADDVDGSTAHSHLRPSIVSGVAYLGCYFHGGAWFDIDCARHDIAHLEAGAQWVADGEVYRFAPRTAATFFHLETTAYLSRGHFVVPLDLFGGRWEGVKKERGWVQL